MVPTTEVEWKFEVTASDLDKAQALLAEVEFSVAELVSVYFDTPDRALHRAGCTLRVRSGKGGSKQTFKRETSDGTMARDEWETPSGPEPDAAFLKDTPAHDLTGGRPLVPLFKVANRRRSGLLHLDGGVVEVALDDAVVEAGGRSQPFCEIELELKSGDPAALGMAADRLKSLALKPSELGKGERGYRLLTGT
ncbi:CYTH domain-containing protein [Caulobacter sp. NIBR2454]|uniref:CYTH domain-containing protein n=1 Tax=Caulobacter sp. NIBR2454 TaxID=3015996 RepID=UPI0022B60D85|nr:CYTH domain-containing protein [Caulobacter sp. NIBR2454]